MTPRCCLCVTCHTPKEGAPPPMGSPRLPSTAACAATRLPSLSRFPTPRLLIPTPLLRFQRQPPCAPPWHTPPNARPTPLSLAPVAPRPPCLPPWLPCFEFELVIPPGRQAPTRRQAGSGPQRLLRAALARQLPQHPPMLPSPTAKPPRAQLFFIFFHTSSHKTLHPLLRTPSPPRLPTAHPQPHFPSSIFPRHPPPPRTLTPAWRAAPQTTHRRSALPCVTPLERGW